MFADRELSHIAEVRVISLARRCVWFIFRRHVSFRRRVPTHCSMCVNAKSVYVCLLVTGERASVIQR